MGRKHTLMLGILWLSLLVFKQWCIKNNLSKIETMYVALMVLLHYYYSRQRLTDTKKAKLTQHASILLTGQCTFTCAHFLIVCGLLK